MSDSPIDEMRYDVLAAKALRGTVRLALQQVLDNGGVFPGAHHAYITFRTDYPGVVLSKDVAARYPTDITVTLQHQFSGLYLSDEGFSVVLSFNRVSQRVNVPWAAISRYYDPSVQFLLQFDVDAPAKPPEVEPAAEAPDSNVVAFTGRKK